ncbi:hypothetical protein QN391_25255 [Pseudomonas sp. CCI1.2]|uniref:hypothetical protein n=1 Tax=Pseudomonas sp. CCI1.2 TaxID=3048614 RepID=UPI002B232E50|nr:hypothetical protein [Pseudomonas sp. CCI1.2]MEB0123963.1 hypothetical protein [Pseudomonas sp. CCI1.2]
MIQKLFRQISQVSLPYSASLTGGGQWNLRTRRLDQIVLMFWPNGKPCSPINAWLMKMSYASTGLESAKTAAVEITPFIRYCEKFNKTFDDISDKDFYDLSTSLREETKVKRGLSAKAREENQIGQIMSRALDFILWYQDALLPFNSHPIAGEKGTGAQLTIEKRFNSFTKSFYYSHIDIPRRRETLGDKHPMPDSYITDIENIIYKKSLVSQLSHTGLPRDSWKPLTLESQEYIYERRMFVNWIMKLTGLRPDEMHKIPLTLNENVEDNLFLVIPISKKRIIPAPMRKFLINIDDAFIFRRYLDARQRFIDSLIREKIIKGSPSSLFLGKKGVSIRKESLSADFKRLATAAGLTDVKVCLSMYRHRFITQQISFEMQFEISKDKSLQDIWSEAVRQKVLSKVAKLTGTSPASLKPYFHDGYGVAKSFIHNDSGIRDINLLNSKVEGLLRLQHDARRNNRPEIIADIDNLFAKWGGANGNI